MTFNPLSLLPPETAQHAAMFAVSRFPQLMPRLLPEKPVPFLGKMLRCPVGLAAGADKEAAGLRGWARLGFGFVEAGTVTPGARAGNPQPRLWRVAGGGVVNWMGLPGGGLAPFVERLAVFSRTAERGMIVLGASLAAPGGSPGDFARMSAAVSPYVDYVAVNASCPNVAHGEDVPDAARGLAENVRAASSGGRPVLVKLGPAKADDPAFSRMAEAALDAGACGFVATNTVPFARRDLLPPGLPAFDWPGEGVGGYSGPALLGISLGMVARLREIAGKDAAIIGCGGVGSSADVRAMREAGADAVQVYTALARGGFGALRKIGQKL